MGDFGGSAKSKTKERGFGVDLGSLVRKSQRPSLPPAHAPKSNTRNLIPGTNCTEIAVSCIRLCSVAPDARSVPDLA
eukprot:2851107-Rhodomonas_salina.2